MQRLNDVPKVVVNKKKDKEKTKSFWYFGHVNAWQKENLIYLDLI